MAKLAEELLRPRSYHSSLATGLAPTAAQVFKEWLYAINLLKNREALGAILWLLHYTFSAIAACYLVLNYWSLPMLAWSIGFILIVAHFYHTFWYHRYCSHKAFSFNSKLYPIILQWTNPLLIKEEIYVIPHFVHHKLSDLPSDPYGPHIGPLGSFFAPESQHYFNRNMSERAFDYCRSLLKHIPTSWQSQEHFIKNGSMEHPLLYPLRLIVANAFWITIFLFILQSPMLLGAWYVSIVTIITILRDFNYRGHDEHVDKEDKVDKSSLAVNHWFYGYLASEWHDNHHRFAASAKCGFKPYEFDLSFTITKLLHRLGIISSYVDSSKSFEKDQQAGA